MPVYDYVCKKCNAKWDMYCAISKRKEPESKPCPKCNGENCVEQSIVNSAMPFIGATRLGLVKPDSKFKERLQQIHDRTAGSTLNQTSTVVDIK